MEVACFKQAEQGETARAQKRVLRLELQLALRKEEAEDLKLEDANLQNG